MNNRMSTVGGIAFGVAIAMALLAIAGSMYTTRRALTAPLPPPPVPVAPAARTPEPPPERVPEMRSIDQQMFVYREFSVPPGGLQDVQPSEKFRVDLTQEGPGSIATGAQLDLDRDGNVDEVWTFAPEIERLVSPSDDGTYSERYRWDGYVWVKVRL